jgi:23S rRNA pseudouridine1911/1915/1917 synthase
MKGEGALSAVAKQITIYIPDDFAGKRIDKALAELCPEYSRSSIQKWLRDGLVLLDDEVPRQRDRVIGGEQVEVAVPEAPAKDWLPEPIELDLRYQDQHLLVINKPAGLVVHPGAGNADGTMLNALLFMDPKLAVLPRAGIVHRLDKDTSGLLVVARSDVARNRLIEQLSNHSLKRGYLALVCGVVISGGTVEEPIGRDRHDRRRMTVTERGKPAVTHYRIAQRFRAHTLLRVQLDTGRTHQIRVHMKYLGFPLLGDPVYGGRLRVAKHTTTRLREALQGFRRQALHANELALEHPVTGEALHWKQRPPADMLRLIETLDEDVRQHGG